MDTKNVVITGEWDGEPIWREKTVADRFAEIDNHDCHLSPEDSCDCQEIYE